MVQFHCFHISSSGQPQSHQEPHRVRCCTTHSKVHCLTLVVFKYKGSGFQGLEKWILLLLLLEKVCRKTEESRSPTWLSCSLALSYSNAELQFPSCHTKLPLPSAGVNRTIPYHTEDKTILFTYFMMNICSWKDKMNEGDCCRGKRLHPCHLFQINIKAVYRYSNVNDM